MEGWKKRRGVVFFHGARTISRDLGGIANGKIESAGGDFAKAAIAIEGDGDADRWVVAGELKAAFEQAIVNFVNVERHGGFAQQERGRLRNRAVEKTLARHFDVCADGWQSRTRPRLIGWLVTVSTLHFASPMRLITTQGHFNLNVRRRLRGDGVEHGSEDAKHRRLGLRSDGLHLAEFGAQFLGFEFEVGKARGQPVSRGARLAQTLFERG